MTGDEYARAVGERLRAIRVAKGLSLGDVNEASGGRWKAAIVGAYERGDRNITVARLADLAAFYGVPVTEVIPAEETSTEREDDPGTRTLTIREDELVARALVHQIGAEELLAKLDEWGLLPPEA
ncbi:MAG: helix-turn-helix domain-containing protein [Actinobacteria bacterium]|nr:helix-turn-helix domain-containing protein [Actinomycetota bacterium]